MHVGAESAGIEEARWCGHQRLSPQSQRAPDTKNYAAVLKDLEGGPKALLQEDLKGNDWRDPRMLQTLG